MRLESRLSLKSASLGITVVLASVLGFAPASIATPEKTNVKIAYASNSGAFGAFWIAKEKGYFKEEGLDAELLLTSTTVGINALSSGNVDAIGTGCAELFEATRKGYQNRIVASLLEDNLYTLASSKDVTKPEQLVGKSVAVNRIGDTGYLSVRYALRRVGVDPSKITFVQIGSTPERFSALSRGTVAGAIQAVSLRPMIVKNGFNMLIDLHKMKIPSCLGAIGVQADAIAKQPKTVEAIVRAIVKGNAFFSAGPAEETKKIFSKYMKLPTDDGRLLLGWSFFAKEGHSRHPKMTTEAARAVMDMMAETEDAWKKERPEGYVDLRFMNGLEKSGFLEKVYTDIAATPKK